MDDGEGSDYLVIKSEKTKYTKLIPLRKKYPELSHLERLGNPQAAIRLFCLQCMGGYEADVEGCSATKCCLYRHRLGDEL